MNKNNKSKLKRVRNIHPISYYQRGYDWIKIDW